MSTPVFSIHPQKSIVCMALMTAARRRHVPVIESGKLTGIISMCDIVHELIIAHKIAAEDLNKYIPGGCNASDWTAF